MGREEEEKEVREEDDDQEKYVVKVASALDPDSRRSPEALRGPPRPPEARKGSEKDTPQRLPKVSESCPRASEQAPPLDPPRVERNT